MRLDDVSALITGGASGLGLATARALTARGARVAVLDVNQAGLDEAAAEMDCLTLRCDVREEEAVVAALDHLREHQGDARVVIQCAGVGTAARVVGRESRTDVPGFARTVAINLIGTFTVMSHAAARMGALEPMEDGERGVVVNTASVAAEDGQVGQCGYAASKAGVAALALPAARELGRFGIRVATIAPGLFATPMMDGLPGDVQERLAALPAFPKRLGLADEYAALALHIVENRMINATMYRLDAGVRLEPR